jgi:hypothetical protein
MALLGTFIDVRTIASIASNGSASFAHGLPAAPDIVLFQATETGSATTVQPGWAVAFDATNVTISAVNTPTPVTKVASILFHSIVR